MLSALINLLKKIENKKFDAEIEAIKSEESRKAHLASQNYSELNGFKVWEPKTAGKARWSLATQQVLDYGFTMNEYYRIQNGESKGTVYNEVNAIVAAIFEAEKVRNQSGDYR